MESSPGNVGLTSFGVFREEKGAVLEVYLLEEEGRNGRKTNEGGGRVTFRF